MSKENKVGGFKLYVEEEIKVREKIEEKLLV